LHFAPPIYFKPLAQEAQKLKFELILYILGLMSLRLVGPWVGYRIFNKNILKLKTHMSPVSSEDLNPLNKVSKSTHVNEKIWLNKKTTLISSHSFIHIRVVVPNSFC
jgi:hypothetical protein